MLRVLLNLVLSVLLFAGITQAQIPTYNNGVAYLVHGHATGKMVIGTAGTGDVEIVVSQSGTAVVALSADGTTGALTAATSLTVPDLEATESIDLPNNKFLTGKVTGGTEVALIGIDSSNDLRIGATTTVDDLRFLSADDFNFEHPDGTVLAIRTEDVQFSPGGTLAYTIDTVIQAAGDMIIAAGTDADEEIIFRLDGTQRWMMDDGSSTLIGSGVSVIRTGATESGSLLVHGGNSTTASGGSFIKVEGDDFGGSNVGGDITLSTGSNSQTGVDFILASTGAGLTIYQDDSSTVNFRIEQDGTWHSGASSFGLDIASAANQLCTTTCAVADGACVFGYDTGTSVIVGCDSSAADHCLCAEAP